MPPVKEEQPQSVVIQEAPACVVKQDAAVPDLHEGSFAKLLRKVKDAIAPEFARVRYDANRKAWAVLDNDNEPIRHLDYGVMEHVVFEAIDMKVPGCHGMFMGVAKGYLRSNTYGKDSMGYRNMSFDGRGAFRNTDGDQIKSASSLRLLQDRRALYKD